MTRFAAVFRGRRREVEASNVDEATRAAARLFRTRKHREIAVIEQFPAVASHLLSDILPSPTAEKEE